MREEARQPLLDEPTGRVKNVLLVDEDGNIRDSLDRAYAPNWNPDGSKRYVRVKDLPLPPLNSAVDLTENMALPEGLTTGEQLRAGEPGAFYFPVETTKGRWYIIVVLGSAGSLTNLLERQAFQSRLYTLAVLLATALLTTVVVWRFTRPLKHLAMAARRVAAGDLAFRVPSENRRDEMGELTQLFNEMTVQLARTRELEVQLHQAEKAAVVGRLASAIAHEIRNPLNYINLTLDHLCANFAPQEPDKREAFARLATQVKLEVARINSRITAFLNYSRPSKLELRRLDLYATATDALRIVEAQAAETGIETRIEKQGAVPMVMGDAESLRSVMTNLIINGLQAIDGRPGSLSIRLSGEDSGRRARIDVTDTGRGIAPEDLPKIFDPYYSTKETGTGLGLAIVKKAIDDHGGTIEATSKPGSGTTFTIRLPAEPT
jgi:nitrogen fixation/metabolism regulation signal transduction histidine kinase